MILLFEIHVPRAARDRDEEWCLPYPICSYIAHRVFIRSGIDKMRSRSWFGRRYVLTAMHTRNNMPQHSTIAQACME